MARNPDAILMSSFQGSLIGSGVGNAIGMPAEWMDRRTIAETYGEIKGYVSPHPKHPRALRGKLTAGQYTDDIALTLSLCESIVKTGNCTEETFLDSLRNAGSHIKSDIWVRELGYTTGQIYESLTDPNKVYRGGIASSSCGPVTRVAPLGLFLYPHNEQLIWKTCEVYAQVTHAHPHVMSITAVVGCLIAYIVMNKSQGNPVTVSDIINHSNDLLNEYSGDKTLSSTVTSFLGQLRFSRWDRVLPYDHSPDAVSVFCSALGVLLCSAGKFRDTALLSARIGGDTDSVAAVACGISGAMNGLEGIPKYWINNKQRLHLENIKLIKGLATELFQSSRRPSVLPAGRKPYHRKSKVKEIGLQDLLYQEGFLAYGQIYEQIRLSALEIDSLDLPITYIKSPRGLFLIDRKFLFRFGSDYVEYVKGREQIVFLIKMIIDEYKDSGDFNERDALANLMERVADEEFLSILDESHVLHAESIRARLSFEYAVSSVEGAIHQVVEGLSIETKVVFCHNIDETVLKPPIGRYSPRKLNLFSLSREVRVHEITKMLNEVGVFLIDRQGNFIAPFEGPAFTRRDNQNISKDCPISDQEFLRLTARDNIIISFSLFPMRNRVYAYRKGSLHSLHSRGFDGEVYRYNPDTDSITTVDELNPFSAFEMSSLESDGFNIQLLVFLMSIAQEVAIHSKHGGILFVVQNIPTFLEDNKEIESDLAYLEGWGHVWDWDPPVLISQHLEKDGAVVIDDQKGTLMAYGLKLTPSKTSEIKAMELSAHILKKHGTKHISAAASTVQYSKSYSIVISERGSITLFHRGEVRLRID